MIYNNTPTFNHMRSYIQIQQAPFSSLPTTRVETTSMEYDSKKYIESYTLRHFIHRLLPVALLPQNA